jgi:type IV fimbrial biogenesis protein FimT
MDRPIRVDGGFTIVELLIALAIAALLLALGVPAFQDRIAAERHVGHAQHLVWTLNRARSEAIKRGFRVNVCKSADRSSCATNGAWDAGFVMFVDYNGDGRVDPDEPLVAVDGPAPPGVRVAANKPVADYVSYTMLGHSRLLNGALQMGTFVVCSSGRSEIHVVLANGGRARIVRTNVPCP